MTTSDDASPDIGTMTRQELEAELRSYEPATEFGVVRTEAHMARRARLWRRLDELLTRPAAATPAQREAGKGGLGDLVVAP